MQLSVHTLLGEYPIVSGAGTLARAGELLNLRRKVLVVTDSGVPAEYARAVADVSADPTVVTLPAGEATKTVDSWARLLRTMARHGFTRGDCVVAVGGGVMGDLAGFAASAYMRGIDFYNIPTTVLAQVDSSVGGKTAVDLDGLKNLVGAFWPPRAVLMDPEVLQTLPPRQVANGLAEAVKMALTFDAELFERMEREDPLTFLPEIIDRSVEAKRRVVEEDETEQGVRKVLNFGHTLGHGMESASEYGLLHGEAVALGMLPMVSEAVRARLLPVLTKLGLPTAFTGSPDAVLDAVAHDKKKRGSAFTVITVEELGRFTFRSESLEDLRARLLTFMGRENA